MSLTTDEKARLFDIIVSKRLDISWDGSLVIIETDDYRVWAGYRVDKDAGADSLADGILELERQT